MDVEKLIKDLCIACAGNQHNIMGVAATAITDLLARAEAAEARVRELETSFRTKKCENGPECAELGRVRKALAEAEARAEKAERERGDFKAKYIEAVKRACELSKIVDDHGWEE